MHSSVFSTPKTIITDNGPEFNNAILAEICRLFKIKLIFMPTNLRVTELSKDLTEKLSLAYVH